MQEKKSQNLFFLVSFPPLSPPPIHPSEFLCIQRRFLSTPKHKRWKEEEDSGINLQTEEGGRCDTKRPKEKTPLGKKVLFCHSDKGNGGWGEGGRDVIAKFETCSLALSFCSFFPLSYLSLSSLLPFVAVLSDVSSGTTPKPFVLHARPPKEKIPKLNTFFSQIFFQTPMNRMFKYNSYIFQN